MSLPGYKSLGIPLVKPLPDRFTNLMRGAMKAKFLAIPVAAFLALSGCSTLAQVAAGTATSLSSETPSQVTTLAEADLAADTIVKLTITAVDTGKLDKGELTEIQALRAGVRAALDALHAANAKSQSLDFAAFNASIQAYQAYTTMKGIQ